MINNQELNNYEKFKYIMLKRMGCYGTCPDYKVQVDYSGNVDYEGYRYVNHIGIFKWKISEEKILKLEKILSHFDYFNYEIKDFSPFLITDNPIYHTAVKLKDGKEKSIGHWYSGNKPDLDINLTRFENKIDAILGMKKYIQGEHIDNRPVCPKCDGIVIVRINKQGDPFMSCNNYPMCGFTQKFSS